jgi:hypothetical protein
VCDLDRGIFAEDVLDENNSVSKGLAPLEVGARADGQARRRLDDRSKELWSVLSKRITRGGGVALSDESRPDPRRSDVHRSLRGV